MTNLTTGILENAADTALVARTAEDIGEKSPCPPTTLAANHAAMLRGESSISDEVIKARGYRTVTDSQELRLLGFASYQCRVPGLLIPLWTTDGSNDLLVYRPDNPRVCGNKPDGKLNDGTYPAKVIKYELPKDTAVRLDCPPMCHSMLADPSIPLWLTEGQEKADALASRGACAVALLGVWNFKGKNDLGGTTFLADLDNIALDGRDVRIVFDSDVTVKPQVRQALDRLTEHLQHRKAHMSVVYLPARPDNKKNGVDDYLANGHTMAELEALIEAPRSTPKPASPIIELLDEPPVLMQRPLALLKGRAYAASWLHVKVTETETTDKKGNIVRHDPPVVKNEQRLFIVRDDGAVYSDLPGRGIKPLAELGLEVKLPEIPPTNKLWAASGIKDYVAGHRPVPAEVFDQVVSVVNRFIDFDRSLADQDTMAEMVACYILATWFLDGFTVIGFLWPNGDRGSGKTQLLTVICELAYLGQVILSGGTFASLRDLADYGACLAFDDAESLSDPKKTDPDKRTLLLAGNRRGNTVPIKEPNGDRRWRTRHVNTFCPRLFSATQLPDPILASRTITVPLIRTPDRFRANADPMDYAKWPCDRQALVDGLWALALAHLAELPRYEAQVNDQATLTGRNLEPWRAILAVAAWLEDQGVPGLWQRIETLSQNYQHERAELETSDLTALTLRAVVDCAVSAVHAVSAVSGGRNPVITMATADITKRAIEIARDEEMDIDHNVITARRIGRVMGKQRFNKHRIARLKRWDVPLSALTSLAASYGIAIPAELGTDIALQMDTLSSNGTDGSNGINGIVDDLAEVII